MKKWLNSLLLIGVTVPITLSVAACSNQPDWNKVPVKPPEIPIDVTGFQGVDFQSMNIKNYDTVPGLINDIKKRFVSTPWQDPTATTWTGTKDDITINLDHPEELTRNGQYKFEIKSNLTLPGDAKFIIKITNSRDIADNMTITNLQLIDDIQPTTILIAAVFRNMSLVSKINEIAAEYLANMTIVTEGNEKPTLDKEVKGTATLTSPATTDNQEPPYFSGTVTLNFKAKLKPLPGQPYDLQKVIKAPDLGTIPDPRMYTILMYVIIKNFVTQIDQLAAIVNNLDIIDIKPEPDHKTYRANLQAKPGSQYFKNSIKIKFNV